MSPPTVDVVDPFSPFTTDVDNPHLPSTIVHVNPVPTPEGEVAADVVPNAFGGGLVDLSLLPLYPDHTVRHIWHEEVSLVEFFIYFYINFNF